MGRVGGLMAALLAAVSPAALRVQEAAPPTPSTQPPSTQPAPPQPVDAAPPQMEFMDAEGNPLPPDIQRELREQFRNNPLPAARVTPTADTDTGDIVVSGQRPRGSVTGDIAPERTFGPLDIRAFGASNIGELLDTLGPQVASNRGREDSGPVTLLNGRRVSDFSEIARIPSEAIERMEVFPEELALRYGYAANQKVVNIVTFERFQSRFGQLSAVLPTESGRETGSINADYLVIRGDTRLSLGMDYSRLAALLESERDVLQLGPPESGRFRTLLPESERASVNAVVSGHLLGDISSTLNLRYEASGSESLLGLGADGPLRRDTDMRVAHVGTTHNGRLGRWSWTFTGNYDRTSTEILTDTAAPSRARDEARSVNAVANADLVLSGPVVVLPAGTVMASLSGGVALRDFESRSLREGVELPADLSRDLGRVQVNLDVPLFSRRTAAASALGTLSANANFALESLSDAGTLRTFGYGLTWSPAEAISVVASVTHEERAPTVEQLGAPIVVTPNTRTFDLVRSEVVDITRVFGGNSALLPDDRRVVQIGINARPLARTDLTLSLDYLSTRIDDPIASFPIVTREIEAAFPDRFTRDGDGRLVRIDGRPVNFVSADQQQIRWGINYTRPLGSVPPGMQPMRTFLAQSEADVQRQLPPGGRFIRAEPGSAMARRAQNMASRLFFSLYHTWHLRDEIIFRGGLPALDLLDGGAIDFRGGRRRHEVEFQAGAFKGGLGARVTANWRSGTTVHGLGSAAGDLRFSDFATVNLNLFANLADRFGGANAPSWLRGTRATIGVANLFNTRPRVRDDAGLTPLSYQPDYLDPLGRVVTLSLRKVF